MRLFMAAAAFLAGAHGVAWAQSAAFLAMENQFERALDAQAAAFTDLTQPEIQARAAPLAEQAFGANWRAVAAETRRTLRALPTYNLAPYAGAEAQTPFADMQEDVTLAAALLQSPAQMAAMRFYDARTVGLSVALTAVSSIDAEMSRDEIYTSPMFANRTFRARDGGAEVLVTRTRAHVVVMPYTISREGMIAPAFERVRVYPRI